MAAAVTPLPGAGQVFAGQIDDPFFVDLGSVFDLAVLRTRNPARLLPLPAAKGVDGVGGFNAHTIALQVPITALTRDGKMDAAGGPEAVIGVYATASRRQTRENLLNPVLDDAPEAGRGDIATNLLTGVPTLNYTGTTQADLLRLNTGIAPPARSAQATGSGCSQASSRASRTAVASRTTSRPSSCAHSRAATGGV